MSELKEQADFMAAVRAKDYKWRMECRYLHASLNGARLGRGGRGWLTLERSGALKGVPDLFLPFPVGKWHGLYIEFKYGKNRATKEQCEFLFEASDNSYAVMLPYSAEEALQKLDLYLGNAYGRMQLETVKTVNERYKRLNKNAQTD